MSEPLPQRRPIDSSQGYTTDDFALADLADLGAQVRSEWQAEYDETVGEARLQWEHGRTLMERIRDIMSRGDQVRIDVADATFAGIFVDLGTNWCSATTTSGTVDVQVLTPGGTPLPLAIHRMTREASGGRRAPSTPMSFRAHLYELEMQRNHVQVGSFASRHVIAGQLTVSSDHVAVVNDDGEAWLPIDAVSWVMTADRSQLDG